MFSQLTDITKKNVVILNDQKKKKMSVCDIEFKKKHENVVQNLSTRGNNHHEIYKNPALKYFLLT
jgi:hypothetical protein